MKRSVQEIVELLVFGLIALLIGTGLLWLAGWIFDLVGVLFKFFAALIWSLLRFIVPVAVGAAIVYALVRLIQQQREKSAANRSVAASDTTPAERAEPSRSTSETPPPPPPAPVQDAPAGGESHPTASEVWVPPQPSPPTSSTETLEEPRPHEDSSPVGEATPEPPLWEPALEEQRQPATDASPLDPTPLDEDSTGSVSPADDETTSDHLNGDRPLSDEGDEDRHHS